MRRDTSTGAANREMTQALGIDIGRVHGFVFALGVVLAAAFVFSGGLAGWSAPGS